MKFTHIFLISFLGIYFFTSCNKTETPPPPNIVWLVSEDNSPYIGVYGDTIARTPNIDKLAESGVVYNNAFANAPVCAPARNTIITGMYANSLGNHQMRSYYKAPQFVKFFPEYLRNAGYYTSNCSKQDYNIDLDGDPWNESSKSATYKNRKSGQPFFHVQNYGITHESSLFDSIPDEQLGFNPDDMTVAPYHPNTPDFRHDWAQYYHRIAQLDTLIGQFIEDLKEQGLYDSTIVFYYGDHGGVLPRGKRYLFESGTRVPMIVHIPEIYKNLMPDEIGAHSDRIVSFVDLAPTILSAAGLDIPEYMQGQPFLGKNVPESPEYAFMFRGRMDERYDLSHAARDKEYRYIRNYYPERIYGQHLNYLWQSRALREWEKLFYSGELNEAQSAYWKTKPYEELYDIVNDPHNIHNLAGDPEYADKLAELSDATNKWIEKTLPLDVIPEPLMQDINKDTIMYEFFKNGDYPLLEVHKIARMSAKADKNDFDTLYNQINSSNSAIAYWAIKSMSNYGESLKKGGKIEGLIQNLEHPKLFIRTITANVLLDLNISFNTEKIILAGLDSDNEFVRLEVLQLYERIPENSIIDKKIKSKYEGKYEKKGYDIRVAKLFR